MKIIFLILLSCGSVMAQTKSDVRKNYGILVSSSYEVRPNVLLTVKYGKEGQVCHMNFKPNMTDSNLPEVTLDLLDKLVDEIVPAGERGRNIINGFLSGAQIFGTTWDYDKLKIYKISKAIDQTDQIYINVVWKDKSCNNFPEFKPWIPKKATI